MSTETGPAARGRGPLIALLSTVGVLAVAVVVALVLLLVAPPSAPAPQETPTAASTAPPTAVPSSPAPPPAPVATIPETCDGLYSSAMRATLTAAAPVQNPPDKPSVVSRISSAEVAAILESLPGGLDCSWRVNMHAGIGTVVVPVDEATATAVETALADSGYTAVEETWGTRWVIEFVDEHTWGESHTIAGGVWFATEWLNFAPEGYTADMVATIVR